MSRSFPIIEQRPLGPVSPGKWYRAARRELSDLPAQPPGSVLVVEVDGHYSQLPGRSRLHGSESELVHASSVLVIDTNPGHMLVARLEIDSRNPGEMFTVCVTFRCSVIDGLAVARSAPRDIVPSLVSHLRSDTTLVMLGRDYFPGQESDFALAARARVVAACRVRPPLIDGLEVTLGDIEVITPDDLRRHKETLRTAGYRRKEALDAESTRQELEKLKEQFTLKQAGLLEEVLKRGPKAIEALYLRLGEDRYGRATEKAYGRQAERLNMLRQLIGTVADGGGLENVALDTQHLIDDFVNSLLEPGENAEERRSYVLSDDAPIAAGERRSGLARGERPADGDDEGVGRPEDPPEEDLLDG